MKFLIQAVLPVILAGFSTQLNPVAASPAPEATADTREVRLYFLDRATPARSLKGAVASLVVERESGGSATFLLPLVEQTMPDSGRGPGMIRGLVGTPYFVELMVEDGKAKPGRASPSPGLPSVKPGHPAPGQLLTSEEVLRRAHRGPCFEQKIPAHLLSGPYQA